MFCGCILTIVFFTAKDPAPRTRSAQASTSSSTPKPHKFLDITIGSKEERIAGETDDGELASKDLEAKESGNTSTKSSPGNEEHPQTSLGKDTNGEDSGEELNNKDDSKATEDVDLDKVIGFLNNDVHLGVDDTEVCFPIIC